MRDEIPSMERTVYQVSVVPPPAPPRPLKVERLTSLFAPHRTVLRLCDRLASVAEGVQLHGLAALVVVSLAIRPNRDTISLYLSLRLPDVTTGEWKPQILQETINPETVALSRARDEAWVIRHLIRKAWTHERDEGFWMQGEPMFGDPDHQHADDNKRRR